MSLLRASLLLAAATSLAACGNMAPLRPAAGQSLPVKALLAQKPATAEELLTHPVYANPERIDELMKRSEPRQPDRFDLPPADGGDAPPPPPTGELAPSEKAGPATPDEPD